LFATSCVASMLASDCRVDWNGGEQPVTTMLRSSVAMMHVGWCMVLWGVFQDSGGVMVFPFLSAWEFMDEGAACVHFFFTLGGEGENVPWGAA